MLRALVFNSSPIVLGSMPLFTLELPKKKIPTFLFLFLLSILERYAEPLPLNLVKENLGNPNIVNITIKKIGDINENKRNLLLKKL